MVALMGLLLVPAVAFGECTITMTSDPALPGENLVKNPGFEEGTKYWGGKHAEGSQGVTDEEVHSGTQSYKIVGDPETNKNFYQSYLGGRELETPIPAGTEIVISAWSKARDVNYEGGSYGTAVRVTYADDKLSYIPAPAWPKGRHDWLQVTKRVALKKDVKTILTLYGGCYYKQEGVAWFDDFFVGVGKSKLSVKVECPNIKRVKLYSLEQGLIKDSGDLPKGSGTHEFAEDVQLLDVYLVEVTDHAGKTYRKHHPEDAAVAGELPEGAIRVTRGLGQETIPNGLSDEIPVAVPADRLKGKRVVLQLKARGRSERVSGCNAMLGVLVNGAWLGKAHILERKNRFTFADGRDQSVMRGKGFTVYYSPDFSPIPQENGYCPVTLPNMDGYTFKFDVTQFVKPGQNMITLKNMDRQTEIPRILIVKDAQLMLKD